MQNVCWDKAPGDLIRATGAVGIILTVRVFRIRGTEFWQTPPENCPG